MPEEANKDQEHLKLLSTFHYVVGVMGIFFSCFPIMHLVIGISMIVSPETMTDKSGNVSPPFVGWMFAVIGGVMVLLGWSASICIILAGRFIARRSHYVFCLFASGLSCLFFPFGTVLGVFDFIVLLRTSVKDLFTKAHQNLP